MPSKVLGGPNAVSQTPWPIIYTTVKSCPHYNCVETPSGLELASKRIAGELNPLVLKPPICLSNSNRHELQIDAACGSYIHSPYSAAKARHKLNILRRPLSASLADLNLLATPGDWTPERWETVDHDLALCTPENLPSLLGDGLIPAFFRAFPNGHVFVLQDNHEAEHRYAIARLVRAATLLPVTDWNHTVPETLSRFHTVFGSQLVANCIRTVCLSTFPHIVGRVYWTPGLWFVLQDDSFEQIGHHRTIRDYADTLVKHGVVGGFARDYDIHGDEFDFDKETLYQKHVWTMERSASDLLIAWTISQANTLASELGCLDNYAIPNGVNIDIQHAYEVYLTIDRCVRRTLYLLAARPEYMNMGFLFEVADQLAEVRAWATSTKQSTDEFRSLFSRSEAGLLKECWASLPEPWRSRFDAACESTYHALEAAIQSSIWARLTPQGVNVSHTSTPRYETIDTFVPGLIRDLRNTHHGYSPDKDREKRRMRLLLSSGELSPSIYFLPCLWMIALLGNPSRFLRLPAGTLGV